MPNILPLVQSAAVILKERLGTPGAQRDFLLLAAVNPHLNAAALALVFDHQTQTMEWRSRDEWKSRGVPSDELDHPVAAPMPKEARAESYVLGFLYPRTPDETRIRMPKHSWVVTHERTAFTPADAIISTAPLTLTGVARHVTSAYTTSERVSRRCVDALTRLWGETPEPSIQADETVLNVAELFEALNVIRHAVNDPHLRVDAARAGD